MPIVTAVNYVHGLLINLALPGSGGSTLLADILPPDPQTDQVLPHGYVYPGRGNEFRQSTPRPFKGTPGTGTTQAGWKQQDHNITVWLTWDQDQDDLDPDLSFPLIVDAVMDALRVSTDPVKVQDPRTYRWSQLFAIGERMTYDIGPPRALKDQRMLRYDAEISLTVSEEFQA